MSSRDGGSVRPTYTRRIRLDTSNPTIPDDAIKNSAAAGGQTDEQEATTMSDAHSDALVFFGSPEIWPTRRFSRRCRQW